MLNSFKMRVGFNITSAQLNVFAAVCSNLVVVWLVAIFATSDTIVTIRDITLAIFFWILAVKAKEKAQKL